MTEIDRSSLTMYAFVPDGVVIFVTLPPVFANDMLVVVVAMNDVHIHDDLSVGASW